MAKYSKQTQNFIEIVRILPEDSSEEFEKVNTDIDIQLIGQVTGKDLLDGRQSSRSRSVAIRLIFIIILFVFSFGQRAEHLQEVVE